MLHCVCVFVFVLAVSQLLLHPQRAEEGVPQRLLQGDAPADVVLQHTADQVKELPLLLAAPLHVPLRGHTHTSSEFQPGTGGPLAEPELLTFRG